MFAHFFCWGLLSEYYLLSHLLHRNTCCHLVIILWSSREALIFCKALWGLCFTEHVFTWKQFFNINICLILCTFRVFYPHQYFTASNLNSVGTDYAYGINLFDCSFNNIHIDFKAYAWLEEHFVDKSTSKHFICFYMDTGSYI